MNLIVGSNPRATLIRAVAIVASAFVVFRFILLPVRLQGISMLPTYEEMYVLRVLGGEAN